MKERFVHYAMPVFIGVYFTIALFPTFARKIGAETLVNKIGTTEIFPFFSFNLFSWVPGEFLEYDLLFNYGEDDAYFLFHNNSDLNKLEIKNYFYKSLHQILKEYEESGKIDLKKYSHLLEKGRTIFLVKLSGDYVEAVKYEKYDIEIISQLK